MKTIAPINGVRILPSEIDVLNMPKNLSSSFLLVLSRMYMSFRGSINAVPQFAATKSTTVAMIEFIEYARNSVNA